MSTTSEYMRRLSPWVLPLLIAWLLAALLFAAPVARAQDVSAADSRPLLRYTLPPDRYEKAVAYARIRYGYYFLVTAHGFLVLAGVIALRVAPRVRTWAERVSSRRIVQAALIVPPLLALWYLLHLPLGVARQVLALQYGQSVQGWGSWLGDWAKSVLITTTMAIPVIALLYAVIRRFPRRAWLVFWLASLPIIVFSVFAAPVVIDPLFNCFEPLAPRHPELVTEIRRVTARGGLDIPPSRMWEMKASEKTPTANAYVTGVGATRRVVVWDTTLAQMTPPQTLAIFGHEMGHYVLGHIPKGIAVTAVVLLLVYVLVFRSANAALRRWGDRWQIRGLDDWASLPVLLLFFSLFLFAAEPVFNAFSRHIEHEADVYGLEVTHGIVPDAGRASAEGLQKLGEVALSDPHPPALVRFWLFSHPPIGERMLFAQRYNPWAEGRAPRFVR